MLAAQKEDRIFHFGEGGDGQAFSFCRGVSSGKYEAKTLATGEACKQGLH